MPIVKGRISMIVPTRNSSRTVEACLASIRAQTYQDVELIVVDNHSTDATPGIARRHADRLLVTGPERSTQRNSGAQISTGEFFLFVDSDMVLDPGVAAEVVRAFQDDSRVQALVIPERSIGVGFWAGCRALEKELYLGDPDVEAARAFRRSTFERVGGYDESVQAGGEDWELPERVQSAGGSIGRIAKGIVHDEGTLSLTEDLRKKFYYGRGVRRYARRSPARALRKVARMAFIRRLRMLGQDPLHGIGLAIMKTLELLAVSAGVVSPGSHPAPGTGGTSHALALPVERTHPGRVRERWMALGVRLFDAAMEDNLDHMSRAVATLPSTRDLQVLDLGCWDGGNVRKYIPPRVRVFGVELDDLASREALGRGVRVVRADLNSPLPWRDQSFDVVTSNQVIEHLCDTDTFVAEIHRVLRRGGLAVISTENLASWHNILALMLGWQAFSLTNVSHSKPGIGNPLANLRGGDPLHSGWEHTRVFSYRGLRELLESHGFEAVRIQGAGYYPLPATIGHIDPRHAAFVTVIGRRP